MLALCEVKCTQNLTYSTSLDNEGKASQRAAGRGQELKHTAQDTPHVFRLWTRTSDQAESNLLDPLLPFKREGILIDLDHSKDTAT